MVNFSTSLATTFFVAFVSLAGTSSAAALGSGARSVSSGSVPPANIPSISGPPTREMHEIRANALEEIRNVTAAASGREYKRDSFGDGTVYDISVGLTACGGSYDNNAWVVAASAGLYDSTAVDGNPNHNTICGRKIWLWGFFGQPPTDVTVVDRCAGCAFNDIDMTPAVFSFVTAGQTIGRFPIGWNWF